MVTFYIILSYCVTLSTITYKYCLMEVVEMFLLVPTCGLDYSALSGVRPVLRCWIDIEWMCKMACASAERIEYELRVQAQR